MSGARRGTERGPHRRLAVLAAGLGTAAAACASTTTDVTPTLPDVPETVELGRFPAPLADGDGASPSTLPPPSTSSSTTTSTTEPVPAPTAGAVADVVAGNRILVIGDTVFASAAPRSGGPMCDALAAFGWHGEIAAEFGRFVSFGEVVVDALVVPRTSDWDVVAIMFGNHFNGDVDAFRAALDDLVASLGPRPVILYTVAEDDTFHADVNAAIRTVATDHANVLLLDWAEIVAAEPDALVADTPSGLSDEGLGRLALFTVATLGEAPVGDEPGCEPPFFVDDSAIVI